MKRMPHPPGENTVLNTPQRWKYEILFAPNVLIYDKFRHNMRLNNTLILCSYIFIKIMLLNNYLAFSFCSERV